LVNRAKLAISDPRVRVFPGGLFDQNAVAQAMDGCHAAVHVVGIIFERPKQGVTFHRIHVEGTRAVLNAARAANVARFVHMSALGTRDNAVSDYHRSKWDAERLVRASELPFTIFRPSLIHGPDGEFMQQVAKWARKRSAPWLFMPYFGSGVFGFGRKRLLQPVFVEDVARAFVDAIESPVLVGQTYDLVGADRLTWPELHRTVSRVLLGRPRWVMPIPAWYAMLLTRVVPASLLPFNRSQVQMALEDNTGDPAPLQRDLGWSTRGFEETLREYVKVM
jgi:NADH dehydrogenase